MTGSGHDPTRRSGLRAGYDDEDPYAGEDIEDYPEWWRRNIEEARRYGLRPYRPPRFADGEFVPPVVEKLESETGRAVRLRTLRPEESGAWEVLLERDRVATLDRYRHSDGYSVYRIESAEFERLVREAADA